MPITVQKVDDPVSWDNEPGKFKGSIFMTSSWLSAVSSDRRIPCYFRFVRNEEIVALAGGLEVLYGKGPEKYLFFYSGIASSGKDEGVHRECKMALHDYAVDNRYYRLIFKSYDYTGYIPARKDQFVEFRREEYVINLKRDKEVIVNGFSPDVRRRARKAAREGVSFGSTYSKKVLDELFKLLDSTRKIRETKGYESYISLGIPFSDRRVLEKLLERKHARMFYAKDKNDKFIGVQFLIDYIGKAYGVLMGISTEGYRKSAPSLLLYEGTMSLKNDDYDYYNIGALPLGKGNSGLKKFKRSLGGEIIESSEEATDFLLPSLTWVNPLMRLKRFLFRIRISWRLKKLLLKAADTVIRGRDHY